MFVPLGFDAKTSVANHRVSLQFLNALSARRGTWEDARTMKAAAAVGFWAVLGAWGGACTVKATAAAVLGPRAARTDSAEGQEAGKGWARESGWAREQGGAAYIYIYIYTLPIAHYRTVGRYAVPYINKNRQILINIDKILTKNDNKY